MEGVYKAHNLQENELKAHKQWNKQITTMNLEKLDEKDEFSVVFWTEEVNDCYGDCSEANSKQPEPQNEKSVHRPTLDLHGEILIAFQ